MKLRARRTTHHLQVLALAAALGLCAVALSQCRMVNDNVTGVSLQAGTLSGKSNCTRNCNNAYEDAIRAEETRHRNAIRACGHDSACKAAENRLHNYNVDQIQDARKDCKKNCYNEGGGGGR